MALTGDPDGPPRAPGWAIASAMHAAATELADRGGPDIDGAALLGERAALAGLRRNGSTSAGGKCRLIPSASGWVAVNLPRLDDVALANAWLGDPGLDPEDPWPLLAAVVRDVHTTDLIETAAPLGLAIGGLDEYRDTPACVLDHVPAIQARLHRHDGIVVVNLSSLWAGPLCAHLLGLAGTRIIDVESIERPDAARHGAASFFNLLRHGHQSVALRFSSPRGRGALRALIESADVVIEGSRPRALAQLGIDAATQVERGAVWVSITAHGRTAPGADRVGFGDDVAIAAGVYAGDEEKPLFCADAVADPIAGLYATVAALRALDGGGRLLLDVSMAAAARHARGTARAPERLAELGRHGRMVLGDKAVAAPHARPAQGPATPLGADTEQVMHDLGLRRWE